MSTMTAPRTMSMASLRLRAGAGAGGLSAGTLAGFGIFDGTVLRVPRDRGDRRARGLDVAAAHQVGRDDVVVALRVVLAHGDRAVAGGDHERAVVDALGVQVVGVLEVLHEEAELADP